MRCLAKERLKVMNKGKINALERSLKKAHLSKRHAPPSPGWHLQVMQEVRSAERTPLRPPPFSSEMNRLLWPLVPITCSVVFMAFSNFGAGSPAYVDILLSACERPLTQEYMLLSSLF